MRPLLSDTGAERLAERGDEVAEEPAVLLVNWPNFVGPCIYCSRKDRVRVVTPATIS